MVSRARFKAILTGLALYAIAAGFITYFGVNAYTGRYGLNARAELEKEAATLTAELAQLRAKRADEEKHVALLRSDRVDPDMLDEEARRQLGYAHQRDLVRLLTR